MHIFINGEKFKIYMHDTITTIINRIALKHKTISQFITITPKELRENEHYKLEFLSNNLKSIDLKEISENQKHLLALFPKTSIKNIYMLWIKDHKFPEDIKTLRDANKEVFPNMALAKDRFKVFKSNFDEELTQIETQTTAHIELDKIIKEVSPVKNMTEFKTTGVNINLKIDPKSGETLMDIFNNIIVSLFIPFVVLRYKNQLYYKIYDKITPPINWVKYDSQKDVSFLNAKVLKSTNKVASLEKSYTDITWTNDNDIYISLDLENSIGEEELTLKFLNSIENLSYKITSKTHTSARGNFDIMIDHFEKYIMMDLITNNKLVSSFLFMNESNKPSSIKKKFFVHYYPHQIKNIEKSLTFIITPLDKGIHITVQKAKDLHQIEQFRNIFAKILNIYNKERKNIENIYSNLISTKGIVNKIVSEPKEKKTKLKLSTLQEYDSNFFKSAFYGRLVHGKKQPKIIFDEEEANDYKKEHGDDSVMEYPLNGKIYYVCNGVTKFPGLKKNTATSVKWQNPKITSKMAAEWEQTYPYLPICYLKPQITTGKGGYGDYIKSLKGIETVEKKKSSYIKTITDKPVDPDRDGKLPINLQNLLTHEEDISITRFGVVNSPNSFIHCAELAFNENYKNIPIDKRENHVKEIRKKLIIDKDVLNIVRQEMPDYDTDGISNYIKDLDKFFDPAFFIRLMEHKYNCNIFLYIADYKKYQKGNISLPFYKNAYFMKEIDSTKKSIIIIKYPNANIFWPYQCEIVKFSNNKRQFILDENIVHKNINALYLFNNQTIVKNHKSYKFKPQKNSSWLKNAQSQAIDNNGKVYMFNYNNFSLYVSPCPPLPIPINTNPKDINSHNLNKLTKASKIVGTSYDKKALFVDLESFDESYVPLEKPLDGYKKISSPLYMNIIHQQSDLELMKNNRKIAHYLKEYTLFLYSINDELTEDNFIIDNNHVYNYKSLGRKFLKNTNVMFKNNKLIVPSKEFIPRLLYYIKKKKINRPQDIQNYKNKIFIQDYYEFISDFEQRSEQLIFVGIQDLIYWIEKETNDIAIYEISNILDSSREIAYFFEDYTINKGTLNIIQNVAEGSLKRALYVANFWNKYNLNVGFYAPILSSNVNYTEVSENNKNAKPGINVFKYPDGKYAAIFLL